MANTYIQIHIHAIVAVKFRAAVIMPLWKERLHQYITGIIQNHTHKVLSINRMPDHLHLFFGFRPNQSLSDLMRLVKGESSEWINKQRFTPSVFRWQEGYAAFSYARSQVKTVAQYVEDQETHHSKKTFLEEYKQFLRQFEVEYDEQYIFKTLE
jgi:REP element-mobilizing transposase RayT